ncbi:SMI1/KNR4 family protein [Sphaerisporangium sp. NPDC051011]|uniref:SMI1/KNR4 family protein n=1 Tax=Sphaerisporangium sp. NPDC051011 TaxID=3155792 RepID=UPI00340B0FFB
MSRFVHNLIEMGVTCSHQISGCTVKEVEEVVRYAGDFRLPDHYLAFLSLMGHGAGQLFRGTSIYYPEPLELNDYAREFAEDDDPDLVTEGRFFFAHHQGYQLYYFDSQHDGVFMHSEGEGQARLIAVDFMRLLQQEATCQAGASVTGYTGKECECAGTSR